MSTKGLSIALGSALTAAAALLASSALGARSRPTFSFVVRTTAIEYLTSSGAGTAFPGRLVTGDRILTSDTDISGNTPVGYDNEICTVTFDGNDLCQAVIVVSGRGDLEATWLWVGRNRSLYGPARFSGVINGGTGSYAGAHGQLDARTLPNGQLRFSAALQ